MANTTKVELKDGMFGIFDNENDVFVIVGEFFVYEKGNTDFVDSLDENLALPSGRKITKLYKACCFNEVKSGKAKVIWERVEEEPVKPSEDGAITITEDQFFEAVKKANEKFMEIGDEKRKDIPGIELVELLMGTQNTLFGELIGCVLFGKEID